MQINNIITKSQNFIGEATFLLKEIDEFLADVKKEHAHKNDFHLVHALVFSKSMSEEEVYKLNSALGNIYRKSGFDVLGGDTSSGLELSIFISTIVF